MKLTNEIKDAVRKYAIKNAIDYGSAQEGAVINKIISKYPELKSSVKELAVFVKKTVSEVNSTGKDELEKEYGHHQEEFKEEAKEKFEKTSKVNLTLEGAKRGSFKTRFPPEPNGYMHVGHAKVAFLESEFSKIYDGKLALFFDDTNPEAEKQGYVDAIKKDLKWLGVRFDEEYYASDNVEKMYSYAETMILSGNAYACTCATDVIKNNRAEGKTCGHRNQKPSDNLAKWMDMLKGAYEENTAVIRLMGDMKSENTVMRDPVLFRIKKAPHYRQKNKYIVWPTYNFSTPIMDSINGVTDAIRSKEYELRDELYYTVLDKLKLKKSRIHSIARLEIANNMTSKRKLNELIANNQISGYDDPRLVTIEALRRRGIRPEAIKELALRFGMSKTDSKVGISMLLAYNRKLIDGEAKRLYFVKDPIEVTVDGMEDGEINVRLRLHPKSDMGYREYSCGNKFFIDSSDRATLKKGGVLRLKDAFNIRIKDAKGGKASADYLGNENTDAPKIQWVSANNMVKCTLNNIGDLLVGEKLNKKGIETCEGISESYTSKLKEGEIVQFERVGFYKLDKKQGLSFLSL